MDCEISIPILVRDLDGQCELTQFRETVALGVARPEDDSVDTHSYYSWTDFTESSYSRQTRGFTD